jgi:cytochrome c-type biogenesis protein CcmH/NrfG
VIAIAPNFEVPYMALGQMYAATQKPADAERSFQKAVELNPQSVEAVRMLAEFYLVNNQVDKAIAALQKAIALQPKAPELHGALGMTYAHGKQFSKAEQSFGKAIALMSPAQAVPMRLARAETLIAQYRYGDAVTDLKEVLRVSPNLIPARAYLGQCYFALEDFDKARVELQAVVKAAPDNEQLKELLKENDARQKEFKEKAKTSMRARQIVVKTRPEAEAVLAELNKGAKFDQLARTKSISPEGADGGDIGFFKKGELNADFEKAVQSLQVGQISGVVQTPAGFHIIQRLN